MSNQLRINLTAVAIALAFSIAAKADASRTFISTTGNDLNVDVNCSPSANCRTFAAALSVTEAGGEIVVLTSGGYGPATIAQPVVIAAIGVDASISVTTSGATGLTINTGGNVTLIGLNLHGEGTGALGIDVQGVGVLRLYNMLIEDFTNDGIFFETTGALAIYGSAINDNGPSVGTGLLVNHASASAFVSNTSFNNNGVGVAIESGGRATVADSSAEYNGFGFFSDGGILILSNDRASSNGIGLDTLHSGTLYFANCLIANNTTAYSIASGTTMAGTSPATSMIAPGQAMSGTLSTAITLQ